jgi:uncharacterized membrane protein HdeD (DUF308 family)
LVKPSRAGSALSAVSAAFAAGVAGGSTEGRPEGYAPYWFRVTEVVLGLASVAISVVVLANPAYQTAQLVALLSIALLFTAVRMIATGSTKKRLMSFEAIGLAGGGVLTLILVAAALVFPSTSIETVIFVLAISLTIQGLGRILHSTGRGHPNWLRGSALATGLVTVALAGIALFVPGLALLTLVPLLSIVVLFNGLESIVSGLRPSDSRQLTLLKLVLFSAFYGLVLVNWEDLYGTSAPAYHIWLILTYMAPFGVLIVFQGLKDWQLAVSLGLLVSLMNDVGYYFVGDLLFGFHKPLVPWIEGQLGFQGTEVLFYFQGGLFNIPVTSILMGLTIYGRIAVVSLVLAHWWRHPTSMRNTV